MRYHLELVRSLVEPDTKVDQLTIAEEIPLHTGKVIGIFLLSLAVSLVQAYYGLHTSGISHALTTYTTSQFELAKLMIGLGGALDALLSPLTYLLFTSAWFWVFLDETHYRQAFVVSVISMFILTVGNVALLPFELWLGVQAATSPFALGVIAHLFTTNEYYIHFFGQISIFLLWAIFYQIYAFSRIAFTKKWFLILITVLVHLIMMLTSVFLIFLSNFLSADLM
ncbi:hypothetical protein [Halalkalibacter okhensis]|uniref:Yip1 domain-containing protein n=1 Tax=Halalkalibacter okhensis TaxID=333138 RepID=A0A0B0IIR9_9BACI|nr:hypothetical protein [Halalkalibacter okhensis]KHF39571.1 hypothetical protein LQ50_14065 [Halalkalibacter okhensis]